MDEYIWSFIEENIVKPHKLMRSEKHGYLLNLAFRRFEPPKHRYFPLSPYNGLLREGVEMDSANRSYFREDFAVPFESIVRSSIFGSFAIRLENVLELSLIHIS